MRERDSRENPIAMLVESVYARKAKANASELILSWMEDAARTPTELEGMLRAVAIAFKTYLRRRDAEIPVVRCTFCRKGEEEVRFLVAASEAAIGDECADIVVQVIKERATPKPPARGAKAALLDLFTRSTKPRR